MSDAKRGISIAEGQDALLVVKCDENGPGSLYFSLATKRGFYGKGSQPFRKFRYRVDAMQPIELTGYHDNNSVTVIEPFPGTAGGNFLEYVRGGNKLAFEVTDYEGRQSTSVINIAGAKAAIARAAQVCGDSNWLK